MIRNIKYEIKINISFDFGHIPIINSISAWLMPRKKISEIINEVIRRDLDQYFLTRDLSSLKDIRYENFND